MDFLQSFRIVSTPAWVKVTVGCIIIATFIYNIYVAYYGLQYDNLNRIEAAAYLFGIVFPVLIISIIIAGSRSGEKALRKRTIELLRKDIPNALALIPDNLPPLLPLDDANKNKKNPTKARVFHNHIGNICYSDYRIDIPYSHDLKKFHRVYIRVEINVRRINFNIMIRDEKIIEGIFHSYDFLMSYYKNNKKQIADKYIECIDAVYNHIKNTEKVNVSIDSIIIKSILRSEEKSSSDISDIRYTELYKAYRSVFNDIASVCIVERFGHTMFAAKTGMLSENGSGNFYQYNFNSKLIPRRLSDPDFCEEGPASIRNVSDRCPENERDYLALVAAAQAPKELLWDPAERLCFVQDMMFMIRAFVREYPDLFEQGIDISSSHAT